MSPIRMSRIESAIRVVAAFNDAFNRHDVRAMLELVSDGCVLQDAYPPPEGSIYPGKEPIARFWENYFRDSAGVRSEIEEIFGFGPRCITRWRRVWNDARDSKLEMRGADIFTVKNDLISEQHSYVKGTRSPGR